MGSSGRPFALPLALALAGTAGCGGGGGAPAAPATGSPSATPTGNATGTPVATPTPTAAASSPPLGAPSPVPVVTGTAQAVTSRPLGNGGRFTYAGGTLTTIAYAGAAPQPSSTQLAAVAQTIAIASPATFAGQGNLADLHGVETDTAPLQTLTVTSDTYEALGAGGELSEAGFTTSDSNGYGMTETYAAPYVLDHLPETAGATFTNGPAERIDETEPGGYTATRTYANDGSYTDSETYPAGAGGTAATSTIVEYADGHGAYDIPTQANFPGDATFTVGSPVPATGGGPAQIPITVTAANPAPGSTPAAVSVPVWYAQPLVLYSETNVQSGNVTLPAPCGVPAALTTTANALVKRTERVDTVLGTDATDTQISYVAPVYGLVCVQLTDVTKAFYDFTGQSYYETTNGIGLAGGTTPLILTTVQSTFGLTAATPAAAARRPERLGVAFALTNLRASFEAAVLRGRLARAHHLADRLLHPSKGVR